MRNPITGKIHYDSLIIEYIKEYQQTGSTKMFHNVLSYFGKLMLRMIWQERKKHKELARVPNQELYHIAAICLENTMRKFDLKRSPIYLFPRLLQNYLKHEIRRIVRDKRRYITCGIGVGMFENSLRACKLAKESQEQLVDGLDIEAAIKAVKDSNHIPEMQWQAFAMWRRGGTYTAIGNQLGRSKVRVREWVRRIVGRIRKQLAA